MPVRDTSKMGGGMDYELQEGHWYRLTLPMGKEFIAEFVVERGREKGEFFLFPDQSRTRKEDLLPYLSDIEEIEKPEENARYDINDFLT